MHGQRLTLRTTLALPNLGKTLWIFVSLHYVIITTMHDILKHSVSPFRFLCLVHNSIALSRVSWSRSRSSSLLLLSSSVWTPATAAANNRFRLPPGPAPPISQENGKTFLSVVKPRNVCCVKGYAKQTHVTYHEFNKSRNIFVMQKWEVRWPHG